MNNEPKTPRDASLIVGIEGFALPLVAVTTTQAILAMKRKGKSYTASVEAEEMLKQGQQIGVVDPTGAWWGLRSSSDGLGQGFAVAIFGGDQGDAALEPDSGRAMAEAWVEHGFSCIFDLSLMTTDEQCTFVQDFCSELLRINRAAKHLFIDEADTYAPQRTTNKLQERCRQIVARLVKQGGKNGCGVTLITQRAAAIDKDILTQVELLTLLRMTHPLDLKPAVDWVSAQFGQELAERVKAEVPKLAIGEAFFLSEEFGIAERTKVRERTTFNSGRTALPGEAVAAPKVLAKIDAAALGQQIAAAVQKTKEESPEFLRAEIERLKAKGPDMGALEELHREQQEMTQALTDATDKLRVVEITVEQWQEWHAKLMEYISRPPVPEMPSQEFYIPQVNLPPEAPVLSGLKLKVFTPDPTIPLPTNDPPRASGTNVPQQKILDAIATLHRSIGVMHTTTELIAVNADTTPRARGFEENVKALRRNGFLEGFNLTTKGTEAARPTTVPAKFGPVVERLKQLSGPQQKMLTILRHDITRGMPIDALAELMQTTTRARGFEENVKALKRYGYIMPGRNGKVQLVAWLAGLSL